MQLFHLFYAQLGKIKEKISENSAIIVTHHRGSAFQIRVWQIEDFLQYAMTLLKLRQAALLAEMHPLVFHAQVLMQGHISYKKRFLMKKTANF